MVAAGLACLVTAAPAIAGDPPAPGAPRAAAGGDPDPQPSGYPANTSDGEPGWPVPTANGRFRFGVERKDGPTWEVAPGLTYSQWTQTDNRGPIRAHLLAMKMGSPGLRLDYADPGVVAGVATVPAILAIDKAVAGVNGDFYDIGRTGAPLGVGKDRQRGLLHGRSEPNAAFYLDRDGHPGIGPLPFQLRVVKHPRIQVAALNPPYADPNTVALYRSTWGRPASWALTHGQRTKVKAVWIERGRVARIGVRLTPKKKKRPPWEIKGSLLVARGTPAIRQLSNLRVGMRMRFQAVWPEGRPRVAITGNRFLVDDGAVRVFDDQAMHPRTAIGIDRDTHQVLLLVVDGRSEESRGYTMVELANLMVELGADDAINLDGGGSSTMVATMPSGRARIVNTPSDGSARRVANALQVTYRPPS